MQSSTHKLKELKQLTAQAKKLFAELGTAEKVVLDHFNYSLDVHWRFGKMLNQLKERVPHGDWEQWRDDAFPKLSRSKAQSCMALDRNNPNALNSGHLSAESVRKFRYGYVPAKERPELKGDARFNRPTHHSSVVVECNKLMRRIETGLYKPKLDGLVRDFDPFYQWLTKLRAAAKPL
jgi:hypothetical protein